MCGLKGKKMSAAIAIACIIGMLLGVGLILFSAFTVKKVPLYFTAVLAVVGVLSVLSSILIFIGVWAEV